MPSNRSITRREVFVPTPFTIWEDEPRFPQPPQPHRYHSRRILSFPFIPPLIRPPTPISACSSPTSMVSGCGGEVDPVKRHPSTGGGKKEAEAGVDTEMKMKTEAEVPKKEGKKHGIAKLVGRVKGAFHKLFKGMRHE